MKFWLGLIALCLSINANSRNATLERLCEVNACWRQHMNASINADLGLPADESSWIAFHLRLVEAQLRLQGTDGLSEAQVARRKQGLDHLHKYWQARRFPINEDYAYRTPIFIDRYDNFCAVGYLIKASGHEPLARYISAKSNLAYVKDMAYPELKAWAVENGFTRDELAWIQPAYGYARNLNPVGKGLDGSVYELYPDTADGKLYVGGRFTHADDTVAAGNMAFVTSAGAAFTWHSMGSIDSTVYAITKYKGRIYAGGSSVYSWNDTAWKQLGCLHGRIKDLAVVNGILCAAGLFDTCGGPVSNFAVWNDTSWQPVSGLTGTVNTLEVMDTTLVLGGSFSYNNAPQNAIKWSQGRGFITFSNRIANEVNDFEHLGDTLYAVCKKTDTTQDSLEIGVMLINNQWKPLNNYSAFRFFQPSNGKPVSIDAVCYEGEQLLIGGSFKYSGYNCNVIPPVLSPAPTYFSVNRPVNTIVVFKENVFIGGDFDSSYPYIYTPLSVNHIGWAPVYGRSTAGITFASTAYDLAWYPNPVRPGGTITIKSNLRVNTYAIYDLTGRLMHEGKAAAANKIALPDMPRGVYLLQVNKGAENAAHSRFEVQ